MKTPVQEVFAHLRALGKIYNDDWLLEMEKAMLEKEKKVIMDAVDYGPDFNKAIDYYNQTFNTKER